MLKARLKAKLICTALLILVSASSVFAADFKIFDGTRGYKNGPELNNSKIKKLEIAYEVDLFAPKPTPDTGNLNPADGLSKEDEKRIVELAKTWKSKGIDLVCLDIELWPTRGDDTTVNESINKFKKVLVLIHRVAPKLKVGIYGALPIRDVYRAIKDPKSQDHKDWQTENDRLKPLAQMVDVIFPSLYTMTTDPTIWKAFAITNLEQAKLYGKPVYPFIWPRYHDSMKELAWTFLPTTFWEMELQTVKGLADGTVIWDYGKWQPWDDQANWWKSVITSFDGSR